MFPFLLLIVGLVIIFSALFFLKREEKKNKQMMDLVFEAKLVQQNLLKLLQETKQISDFLIENVEKAGEVYQQLPFKSNNEMNSSDGIKINKADPVNSKHEQVKKMWREGVNIEDIARAMSIGKGEVQLIITLMDKEVAQ